MSFDSIDTSLRNGIRNFGRRLESVEPGMSYFQTWARLGVVKLCAGMLRSDFARAVAGEKAMLDCALMVNAHSNQFGYMLTLIEQVKQKMHSHESAARIKAPGLCDAVDVLVIGSRTGKNFERAELLAYAEDLEELGIANASELARRIRGDDFPNNLDREFLDQFRGALAAEALRLKQAVTGLGARYWVPSLG